MRRQKRADKPKSDNSINPRKKSIIYMLKKKQPGVEPETIEYNSAHFIPASRESMVPDCKSLKELKDLSAFFSFRKVSRTHARLCMTQSKPWRKHPMKDSPKNNEHFEIDFEINVTSHRTFFFQQNL